MPSPNAVVLFGACSLLAGAVVSAQKGLPLRGPEAEAFLREAKVEHEEDIGVGVTHPQRLVLSNGGLRYAAVWKTVDIFRPGITRFDEGGIEANFADSYKYEIAAYELDKLLGLELVPPTVERRIHGQVGALQLWVEHAFTEWDRREGRLRVPSPRRFVERKLTVRLLDHLIYDTDYRNGRNILIGEDGFVWSIDHSRAFRLQETLLEDLKTERFSRSALESLRRLDLESLDARLHRWLTRAQMEALLARRDLLVEAAERVIAEKGELAALFP